MIWLKPTADDLAKNTAAPGSPVRLKSQYLLIDHEVAQAVFGDAQQAYLVYYPQQQALFLAPKDDPIFSTIHKATLAMLKDRTPLGDKSLSLQEIIIDNDLDDTDRDLEYFWGDGVPNLHVKI
jgi:hypothetical protein